VHNADRDLGVHQGARRILELEVGDVGVINQNIAAGGAVDSAHLYAPGFTHFMGQLSTDTPIATILSVRIVPRISSTLGTGGVFVVEEFEVALLTTLVGLNDYSFYWGEARGLSAATRGTGSTFSFSPVFLVRLRNTGGQPANTTSVVSIVAM
jgi:hypothetical protein